MTRLLSSLLLCTLATAACGGDAKTPGAPATEAPATAAPEAPAPTGTVIEVKAISEGARHYFEPDKIEAKRGDVIKVVLVSGVHNMAFPAAKNPAGVALPEPTPMLQLPGQTAEIPVAMPPGDYNFICVPHEALGMVGTLEVEDD